MISPWFFAIVGPIIWGLVNVFDKYILVHKVKNSLSYAVVAGIVNVILGIIIALFVQWKGYSLGDVLFPILAGILIGIQFFFYFVILRKGDASHIVGLIYLYPICVALLSFIYLNEIISPIGYFGIMLTILGTIILSTRLKNIKMGVSFYFIGFSIVLVALNEFFIKVSTNNLPILQGLSLNMISLGLVVALGLFSKKVRKGFIKELKNYKLAIASESMTVVAIGCLYAAMNGLPATIVTSVSATQPLAVLFFEYLFDKRVGRLKKDHLLLPQLIAIIFIVVGVALLYISEAV